MIQARAVDNFQTDGISIGVRITGSEEGRTDMYGRIQVDDDGRTWLTWELPGDPVISGPPTLQISHEVARAILDALLRFYEGASDMRQIRQDLLHERGRVDKLLDTVTQLACRPQDLHIHKAEQ